MLKVKTKILPSLVDIDGIGIFAATKIKSGRVVWIFEEDFDRRFAVMPSHPLAKKFVIYYGYKPLGDPNTYYLCIDNMRFINHSVTPNIVPLRNGYLVAARDIEAKEELTINYTLNYFTDDIGSQLFY